MTPMRGVMPQRPQAGSVQPFMGGGMPGSGFQQPQAPGAGGVGFGGPIRTMPFRGSFDKLKGKKKIKKSGLYKLKRGETVEGKKLNELM